MNILQPEFPYTPAQIEWLETLEGKRGKSFEQAKAYLCIDEGDGLRSYCCLGVACEISKNVFHAEFRPDDMESMRFMGEESILPYEIVLHFNLRDVDGKTRTEAWIHESWFDNVLNFQKENVVFGLVNLTTLNDAGASFGEIALHIRRFPHFYFYNGGIPTEETYPFLTKPKPE